jgi:hypothetical protein
LQRGVLAHVRQVRVTEKLYDQYAAPPDKKCQKRPVARYDELPAVQESEQRSVGALIREQEIVPWELLCMRRLTIHAA